MFSQILPKERLRERRGVGEVKGKSVLNTY